MHVSIACLGSQEYEKLEKGSDGIEKSHLCKWAKWKQYGMLYHTSNRVLNNGIKVIILIFMDGPSQYRTYQKKKKKKKGDTNMCLRYVTDLFLS